MEKGRILVVEDDPDISNLLRIYFDSQGYKVLVAPKGKEALHVCRRELPNVIVLDIQLPDIDGYEVCQKIRAFSAVPIIMLTALAGEADYMLVDALVADPDLRDSKEIDAYFL